jgi:hypothetical protein
MGDVDILPPPGEALVCANPECDFAQTGDCTDGLEPADCPQITMHGDSAEERPTEAPAPPQVPPVVRLFGATALSPPEADDIAAVRGATMVLLAGEAEAGKTTLLVSLFELFRQGPLDEVRFAGSQTLMAFEERAWPGRAASGVNEPDTERTVEGLRFLHLLLHRDGQLRDVLLTDIWGEPFENIIEGDASTEAVPLVGRADVAIVLVDGERIANLALRQDTVRRARMLVGGLTENGALREQARLIVALNKTDTLTNDDRTWWSEHRDEVAEPARRHLSDVHLIDIAARPAKVPHTPQRLGELLRAVLEPTKRPSRQLPHVAAEQGRRALWTQE